MTAPQSRRHVTTSFCRQDGEAIRARRLAAGMTQAQVATIAGVSVRTIGGVEKSSTKSERQTILAIARALHCPPTELVKGNCPSLVSFAEAALAARPAARLLAHARPTDKLQFEDLGPYVSLVEDRAPVPDPLLYPSGAALVSERRYRLRLRRERKPPCEATILQIEDDAAYLISSRRLCGGRPVFTADVTVPREDGEYGGRGVSFTQGEADFLVIMADRIGSGLASLPMIERSAETPFLKLSDDDIEILEHLVLDDAGGPFVCMRRAVVFAPASRLTG